MHIAKVNTIAKTDRKERVTVWKSTKDRKKSRISIQLTKGRKEAQM